MGRESAREMTKNYSLCVTAWGSVNVHHVHDVWWLLLMCVMHWAGETQRNTLPVVTSSCRYAGECGRIDDNVSSYQHGGDAIAVEITQKNLEGAVSRRQRSQLK